MIKDLEPTGALPCRVLLLLCWLAAAAPTRADDVIDLVMFTDPDVPAARVVKVFPPRLTGLWLRALERPEHDLKCQAAAAVAQAHRRGMPGLEATVPALLRALDQPGQHRAVQLAAAQALVTLNGRQAADSLFRHGQADGVEMRNLVEPALARWGYAPARTGWLERLNQSRLPGRGWVLAIQGLGAARELRAAPRLRELVMSSATDAAVRLEAARALGAIQTAGLEKDAERLAATGAKPGGVAHLAAAWLLRNHRGDEAVRVLQRLAVDSEPAAAAVALDAILDDDPRRVLAMLPRITASPDAAVRGKAVEAFRRRPLAEHVAAVAEMLDDPHPDVRAAARKALLAAARTAGHGDAVRRDAAKLLATNRWRALEQATIVLATLDHKPAAPRFVELLQFERPEVFLTAAWGLRKLAVPETLPAQLREIERRWEQSLKPGRADAREMIDRQVSQLAQSLGQARYAPASPVLARFIPKQWNIGGESRAAAIWALGLIHQKDAPERLVDAITDRLSDESVTVIEDLRVRRMCAVALGRMKAKDAVESLRKYYPRQLSVEPFPNACGWALEQITGEKLPVAGTAEVVQRGWFLEPTD